MSQPNGSSTPKGAGRTQTSIFKFFSTPKKTSPAGSKTTDSQDALLDEIGAAIDDDVFAEIEETESTFASPVRPVLAAPKTLTGVAPASRNRKRKASPTLDELQSDASGSDTADDDEDADYNPSAAVPAGPNGKSRGRVVDDSDDDIDDIGDIDDLDLLDEADASPPSSPSYQARQRSSRGNKGGLKTPNLKRIRASGVASSTSSKGVPLMSALMPTTPTLARTTTSLSALSVTSSGSAPPMQRMQLQAPPTADDSKRARAAKFAKKNDDRYSWLVDVRDAQGVRPGEAGYDKRSLLIPRSAWNDFSAFERQYWEIKGKHWDTVVFFKKGKFYELYENDATIGHQEFDLKMTDRVNMRMAGVPESSFDHWVAQFLAKGYKVARVDQMESKLAKDMRERGSAKKGDGLVTRELTGILTAGTLVDPSLLTQDLATYCMAIVEGTSGSGPSLSTSFGVAFVDTSTAQFSLCTIKDDDADRSALETLLVQINPREVVYVRGGAGPGQRTSLALSSCSLTRGSMPEEGALTSPDAWDGMAGISRPTWRALKNMCGPNTDWISMAPRKEFWDVPTTRHEINEAGYFTGDNSAWPTVLQQVADNDPLALMAVGGLLAYLRSLKLDQDLPSLGNFSFYAPLQRSTALVLDGSTISNLELFSVSSESGAASNPSAAAASRGNSSANIDGTLFALVVNHARTPFGRRLLSRWMCHPLRHAAAINARLDAVEFLMAGSELSESVSATLRSLPGLERGLSRIHSGRCKISDFIALLSGLRAVATMISQLRQSYEAETPVRIQTLLRAFPALDELLVEFGSAYDSALADTQGLLLPFPGSDQPYDDVLASIAELDTWFDQHLAENRKRLSCASIVYKNMGKEHYQLEMPATIKVPSDYFRLSATKAVNRYWSPELRGKVQEHAEAMETKSMVLNGYQQRLYTRFDRHYGLLMKAVAVVAELDCLLALSVASASLGSPSSRPTILERNGDSGGYIEFRQLRHPCVAISGSAADFVANDIVLGRQHGAVNQDSDPASMILLTGPNMGGKSTLLRQLCLGVILAQLGCYVPAESATILPVDRLFTRIGARDNLLAGRSTFMVEMAETSTILRYATPRSLVVLDELGRGTSTHDGEAVAYGVLHGLCSRLGCLGFFSTHYGLLAESLLRSTNAKLANNSNSASVEPHLRPMYMACAVNEEEHRVTFLYRLQRGVASKSHGMNVAAMAGVPIPIVQRASAVAAKFELRLKQRQLTKVTPQSGTGLADDNDDVHLAPLSIQSDFANLLRMAALQTGSSQASNGDDSEEPEESPVGGTQQAKRANENQYWSCIVDHLQRTMISSDN
ncbi:DNA mismatch repair protein msh6 [Coemansia aciculifera]|uniref:DNA mismatch repair protein n=1 Tax=Coemansia aciculifera TaxID=417176 RepID=A0A9W8IP97_9FUNG|nr:DNA mismatch repair protein msh6 [Coemansia aciculifera]